ncbi:MAG: Fic family protein [Verrucomicrobiota bacterium]
MADPTTRPAHATRTIETSFGLLTYAELAPLLAERVQRVQEAITRGDYDDAAPSRDLICAFHSAICADLVPGWSGRWRSVAVVIGSHEPPLPHDVPLRMHDFEADLGVRLDSLSECPELLPETLAFAEGRLLSVHPFQDFNGRVTRLFLPWLLRHLELPPADLVPVDASGTVQYLAALRAADRSDWRPLASIWEDRLAAPLE